MIKHKILSKVLNKDVLARGFRDKYRPNDFEYIQDDIDVKVINCYELSHLIKEWLLVNGFELRVTLTYDKDSVNPSKYYKVEISNIDGRNIHFSSDITDVNEFKAIEKTANLLWKFI